MLNYEKLRIGDYAEGDELILGGIRFPLDHPYGNRYSDSAPFKVFQGNLPCRVCIEEEYLNDDGPGGEAPEPVQFIRLCYYNALGDVCELVVPEGVEIEVLQQCPDIESIKIDEAQEFLEKNGYTVEKMRNLAVEQYEEMRESIKHWRIATVTLLLTLIGYSVAVNWLM